MPYALTDWQDSPSNSTPLTSTNLLLYNIAINDLDTRIAAKQATLAVTGVQTSNYSALANQIVPVDTTSGSVTITFPTAPADQTQVGVKQVTRGGNNTVILQLGGSDTFNTITGPQAFTLQVRAQGAIFQYIASTAVWLNIADDIPLSQTTGRSIAMAMVLGAFAP